MNPFVGLLLLITWPVSVLAQSTQSTEPETFSCSYFGSKTYRSPCDNNAFLSNRHAEEVVDRILRPVGLSRNFSVVECPSVENCYALVRGGRRFIVYDNSFMKLVEDRTQNSWAAISIMAHEIAHHLEGHTVDGMGSRPEKELIADRWSGWALHQMGATLDEAQLAMRTLQSEMGDYTHPARSLRLAAIEKGWREAESLYPRASRTQPSVVATPVEKRSYPAPNVDNPVENRPTYQPERKTSRPVLAKETGCITGDCTDGEGIFVHSSGEKYEGEWSESKRNGWGIHYYANGRKKYEGQFLMGKRHGKGNYIFQNGDRFVGDFQDDQMSGKGTYFYVNGDRYFGEFRNNRRHGKGTYVYANGQREVNFYVDDTIAQRGRTEE
ncbi:MAG: hypothetical protein LH606_16855 [Cytophagaceae bacterium]|nr:hypothetical protein [Cytophagaceae bacterium]